jgi:hypothetical protein
MSNILEERKPYLLAEDTSHVKTAAKMRKQSLP